MDDFKIFACPTAVPFTEKICNYLKVPLGEIEFMKFANDNSFVKFGESIRGQEIFIVQTTMPPVNERVMELLIAIDAAKRISPAKITVVLPYYFYARSDKKDQPRIPITAKLIADLLEAAGANSLITCDLHNSSIQGFFNISVDHIKAKKLLESYFLEKKLKNLVVVAPDAGSAKKAHQYARDMHASIAMLDKRRDDNSDHAIATTIVGDVKGKNAIIFDDEIDTAGSLMQTVEFLNSQGVNKIYAACTHGILSANAIERIATSPIEQLVITDTVPLSKEKQIDKIKVLSIAEIFGEVIIRNIHKQSIGTLF